ncbi:hypothetical protein Mapa_005594 [Marchantia paleacea]|nr:hypothetical protein Mapa_005594 [Marchantia paleacea]
MLYQKGGYKTLKVSIASSLFRAETSPRGSTPWLRCNCSMEVRRLSESRSSEASDAPFNPYSGLGFKSPERSAGIPSLYNLLTNSDTDI